MRTTVRPVESWFYQLQNVDRESIRKCEADVVVIDPYGPDGKLIPSISVMDMQLTAKHKRRRVIAYVSIGEAEDYRPYWRANWKPGFPAFIDAENPYWKGNYKVKYWEPAWQAIVKKNILDVLALGFDGVYLDVIDAFEYYENEFPDAEYEMADFVIDISEKVKATYPKAWIIPQNGERLLKYREYRNAIDAIGKEDIYYNAPGHPNSHLYVNEVVSLLRKFSKDGKPVLCVEYDLNDADRAKVSRHIYSDDFGGVFLLATRELDKPPKSD